MHEFDGKALIFMIFNNDAIKKELSGLLDTSRQARRHHLIFLLKIALAMFLILCFAGFAIGIGFVRGAIDAAPSLDIDRKSTRLNSSHNNQSRMPSSA